MFLDIINRDKIAIYLTRRLEKMEIERLLNIIESVNRKLTYLFLVVSVASIVYTPPKRNSASKLNLSFMLTLYSPGTKSCMPANDVLVVSFTSPPEFINLTESSSVSFKRFIIILKTKHIK